ncbi:MAG: ATP-dependent DNA ligase [Thermoplasmata archaeon]
MKAVRLSDVVSVLSKIRATSSRNEKVSIAAEFLLSVPSDQLADTSRLMIGQLLPKEFGSPGVHFADLGDAKSIALQTTLFSERLTVSRVVTAFKEIYSVSGKRARQRKASILRGLLIDASKDEIEFLFGCMTGDVRAGFSEGLLLESIAKASGRDVDFLRGMLGTVIDIGRLAESVLGGGSAGARAVLEPMRPVRVMLAESSEDIGQALSSIPLPVALEYKLDGIRVQIHVLDGDVRIFSRRQTDVTESLPEIVEAVRPLAISSAILDGEVIAFKGKPLPFQEVMRRVTRERDIAGEAEATPLRLYLFDVLYLNGESLIDFPYESRSERLSGIAPSTLLVPKIITSSQSEAERFLRRSLSEGHEGVIVKSLSGKYELGRRSADWLKVKERITIDAVIIAAEWGHGRRSNWLSNYHLGVKGRDGFVMVGKTFKGVSDAELKRLTDMLLMTVEEDHGNWVKVRPTIVLEIAFNEIQRSPKYDSGMALRFARVLRIREDKAPGDSTTEEELRRIMERQFVSKAKRMK